MLGPATVSPSSQDLLLQRLDRATYAGSCTRSIASRLRGGALANDEALEQSGDPLASLGMAAGGMKSRERGMADELERPGQSASSSRFGKRGETEFSSCGGSGPQSGSRSSSGGSGAVGSSVAM